MMLVGNNRLDLLDRSELAHFARALDTAGAAFGKAIEAVPDMTEGAKTRLFWVHAVEAAPDEQTRALAVACLNALEASAEQ